MSDSPPPEATDGESSESTTGDDEPGEIEPIEAETAQPRRGGWSDIEDGVGYLFAAFERGVLNIADAEGRKRQGADASAASTEAPAAATRESTTSDGSTASDGSMTSDGSAASDGSMTSDGSATSDEPVVRARPGMTYDEVLTPIRWRNLIYGLIAVVVLGAAYFGITLAQVVAAADDADRVDADAIVVLGAAQFDGTPSPVLASRLDHAVDLWNDGRAEVIMTTGSNQEGDRFTEGFSGFVHLREAGVPEDAIVTIVDGADTYQQLTAAQAQLEALDLDTALLVSDGYHTHRLRSIADEIDLSASVWPTSVEPTTDDYLRETAAVSVGRLVGYRRLSAWNTPSDDADDDTDEADDDTDDAGGG